MVQPVNIVKGVLCFLMGLIFIYVSQYIIPPLANELLTGTTKAIFYVGLIILYVLAVIVAPAVIIFQAEDEDPQ